MPIRSREARAERLVFEETLKARLAKLEANYTRLDEGLSQIETEMTIEGAIEEPTSEAAASPVERPSKKPRRYRPRKPR